MEKNCGISVVVATEVEAVIEMDDEVPQSIPQEQLSPAAYLVEQLVESASDTNVAEE